MGVNNRRDSKKTNKRVQEKTNRREEPNKPEELLRKFEKAYQPYPKEEKFDPTNFVVKQEPDMPPATIVLTVVESKPKKPKKVKQKWE